MVTTRYARATMEANMKLAEEMAEMSKELNNGKTSADGKAEAQIKLFNVRVNQANGAIRAGTQLQI